MNCQDIARILDEKEVESLLATELSDVQAHLAACRDCAREWQIHSQLTQAEIPVVPAELRAKYSPQEGGASDASGSRRSRFAIITTFVALVAAAATLVMQLSVSPKPMAASVDPVRTDFVKTKPSAMQILSEPLPSATGLMSEYESAAVEQWTQRVAEWLAIRDDPDALITAAVLLRAQTRDSQRIQSLLRRATAMAPDSARINATAMLLCLVLRSCDATPYEAALRRLAPDNALGWAEEVKRASQADDQEALRSAMATMARAKTYDLYWNASILSMTSQIRSALVAPPDFKGPNSPPSSEVIVIGAIAAMPIPGYQPITKVCKSATDERALLECSQIGAAMRVGDTVMVNSIGLTLSSYGLSADSGEARSLVQQRNLIKWVLQNQPQDSDLIAVDPRFLKALADYPREIDAERAYLEELGIPGEPPAGGKP